MEIVCLDLEGTLVPEIWIAVAKKTGIKELERTTRDEPDYNKLMQQRIAILKEHNLTLADIQSVIATVEPMAGAEDFIKKIRSNTQLVILSDTFSQFAKPIMEKLGWPTIFCNELVVDENNMICGIKLRQQDQKRKAVEGLKNLGFRVFAAGDSYNDISMIEVADGGCLFRTTEKIHAEHPEIDICDDYNAFYEKIDAFLENGK